MGLQKASELAMSKEMDLVEVAPKAVPPVCKIMDYGKYLYHQDKLERKQKKMQKRGEVKGIRLGFKTGEHDIDVRVDQARKFLEDRNLVKVVMMFKGREVMYIDMGMGKLKSFYEKLSDIAEVEQMPKRQGNSLLMILTPKKNETKVT
jgi:translation initiation factor IF-3